MTTKYIPSPHIVRSEVVYPPLTYDEALTVRHVHQNGSFDSKGNCRVWRRNGATQTWKRPNAQDIKRFRLPLKYGMYSYDAITEYDANKVHTDETCPFSH